MSKIKDKLLQSAVPSPWQKEAEYREENESWLDISFSIAVKVKTALKAKGMTQKSLAEGLKCSPQYVTKLLKGQENLQISTISRLEKVLGIQLITIPETTLTLPYMGKPSASLNKGKIVALATRKYSYSKTAGATVLTDDVIYG